MKNVKKFFRKLGYALGHNQFINHISFLWHWKNFFFLLKYPFYRAYNVWKGKFCGYSFTEYDNIPKGWRIAFGKQMSEEIKKAGKESRKRLSKHLSWKKMIQWQQIKEKWGELRLYASATDEIREVLDKYELLSTGYCLFCGKPARYRTYGWIEYLCSDCFEKEVKPNKEDYEKCRLTKKDIPLIHTYTKGKNGNVVKHKVDLKKKYNIDFVELWGLDNK